MADYYKSIYSGAQIDTSLGRIINGELDTAVDGANAAAGRAESAADAIQSAIDNLPVGAVPVIDDLTTGGRTVALSAEQGKALNVEVDAAQAVAASALEAAADHAGRTDNPHGVTAAQIGAIPGSEKGAPNGVAPLGSDGKLPAGNLLLSNDNLLDNAWFPCAENQRGQSSYSGSYLMGLDRWTTNNLTISSTGAISNLGVDPKIYEVLEPSRASGTVTISALFNGKIVSSTGEWGTGFQAEDVTIGTIIAGVIDASRYYVQFTPATPGQLTAMKLELGPVSTLHLDMPPSPAEQELNRQVCKRYYRVIGGSFPAFFNSTSEIRVQIQLDKPMRINATPVGGTIGYIMHIGTYLTPQTLSTQLNTVTNGVGYDIKFVTDATNFDMNAKPLLCFIRGLVLSADL